MRLFLASQLYRECPANSRTVSVHHDTGLYFGTSGVKSGTPLASPRFSLCLGHSSFSLTPWPLILRCVTSEEPSFAPLCCR